MPDVPDRLFAHMGAHKTGSTFLQRIFLQYSGLIAGAGVHYIPRKTFFSEITCRNMQWRSDFDTCIPTLRDITREMLPSWQPAALMISDETFTGHILGDPTDRYDSFYRDCDRPVELLKRGMGSEQMFVIFFIRSIDEFLESCYLQHIRVGSTMSFDEYVSGFDLARISWLPTIRKLGESLSSGDRVWVYDYQTLKDDPHGVLTDLFGRMGASFPSDHRHGERVNESFTPLQYKAVMGLNRIWPAGSLRGSRKKVFRTLRVLRVGARGKIRFFSPQLREMLVERHRMELVAIQSMGGVIKLCPNAGGDAAGSKSRE